MYLTRLCPILCLGRLTSHFTNLEFDQVFLISVTRLLNRGKISHISSLISVQVCIHPLYSTDVPRFNHPCTL